MQTHSTRFQSVVLVATGLAATLLLVIPVTGLAQTKAPDDRQPTSAKQALLEREAQEIRAARAAPKPPKSLAKPARIQRQPLPLAERPSGRTTASPLPHRSAGSGTIVESGQAPFPASTYTFENRWFERTADGDLVVYAGAARDDPAQGLVAVRLIGAAVGPATVYRTPARFGAIRIVGAEGNKLALVASSGARLAFDVSSRSFGP
jgi:hypothetical protein